MNPNVLKGESGTQFPFGDDIVTIKADSNETNGEYSLMHWVVAPDAIAPAHIHAEYEETFYVLEGKLQFTVGEDIVDVEVGDFIRCPAGTRHGYVNSSGKKAVLLVGFTPGGMEQIFRKYSFLGDQFDLDGYLDEARTVHQTEYEVGS